MNIKVYNTLPKESKDIRISVFMDEQGFKDEFDDIDTIATHLVLFEGEEAVGTARFYYSQEKKYYLIGRIAIKKEHRGKKYGAYILKSAEEEIAKLGVSTIGISAQLQAKEFYKKQGYEEFGELYYDEECPHIWMKKTL